MSETNHSGTMSSHWGSSREQAIRDFDAVLGAAQGLLQQTATAGAEQMDALRTQIDEQLSMARSQLMKFEGKVQARAQQVDSVVHRSPWAFMAMAAGLGLAAGALWARAARHSPLRSA